MFGLSKYALIAALVALAGSVAVNGWQVSRNAAVQAENERLRASLATCSARVANILEDAQSDATVTDPDLFPVPDSWLRETAPAGD